MASRTVVGNFLAARAARKSGARTFENFFLSLLSYCAPTHARASALTQVQTFLFSLFSLVFSCCLAHTCAYDPTHTHIHTCTHTPNLSSPLPPFTSLLITFIYHYARLYSRHPHPTPFNFFSLFTRHHHNHPALSSARGFCSPSTWHALTSQHVLGETRCHGQAQRTRSTERKKEREREKERDSSARALTATSHPRLPRRQASHVTR